MTAAERDLVEVLDGICTHHWARDTHKVQSTYIMYPYCSVFLKEHLSPHPASFSTRKWISEM